MAQAAGYSFNRTTVKGTTVRDLAGYFLHGTILGNASIVTDGGKYGDGLNCTGGAMRVTAPDDSYPVNTDGGLAVAAWVKLNTTTAAARCVASANDTADNSLTWALYASNSSGNVEFRMEGVTYSTTTSIRDNAYHHLLVVVDRTLGAGSEIVRIIVDGTTVQNNTGLTLTLAYSGGSIMEVGRNVVTGVDALDGIVDDVRWWNDPIESAMYTSVRDNEQVDFQYAAYSFDDTAKDLSAYNRHLTKTVNGTYVNGLYGRALQGNGTGAAASGTVSFGDMDRLSITGWVRLDALPGSAAPMLALTTSGGTSKMNVTVNTDGTVTAQWVTVYGTLSVTSPTSFTVGTWTKFHLNMNPTYVGIRLGTNTQTTTATGNSFPVIAPTVTGCDVLYVGGNATGGAQVSIDYLNFTKNFVESPGDDYWSGPITYRSVAPPTTGSRGVYHFNEGAGSTANDDSPVGTNDLTLTTAGSWVSTGIEGTALGANGTGPGASNSSISWAASPLGFAYSAWVKCRTSSTGARFLVLRNGTSDTVNTGRLGGYLWVRLYGAGGNNGAQSTINAPIPSEIWTHVGISCNGDRIQFYFNGNRVSSQPWSLGALLSPTQIYVGGDNPDQSVADVDELYVYDSPISSANMRRLYELARITDTYDGGTDGAALSQSGITVSGTITYTTTYAIHGSSGVITPNSSSSNYYRRDLGSNPTTHTTQTYFRVLSSELTGTQETSVIRLAQAGTNTQIVHLKVNGNRKVTLNSGDNLTVATSTNTFEYGAPIRAVIKYDDTNASAVRVYVDLYFGINLEGETPDETLTLPVFTPGGTFGRWMWGNVGTPTPSTANRQIAFDSWQYFGGIVDAPAFGAGTTLNVASATQAQTSSNVTLSLGAQLVPSNPSQAQTASNVVMVYNSGLGVAAASQAQTSGSPTLVQVPTLVVSPATQTQTSGTVSATQVHNLTVAGNNQSQVATTVALTQVHELFIGGDGAFQEMTASTVTLPVNSSLVVQGATQAQTAGAPGLGVALTIQGAAQSQISSTVNLRGDVDASNASQAQTATNVVLVQAKPLVVQSAAQAQVSGTATLAQQGTLTVASAAQPQVAAAVAITQRHQLAVNAASQAQTAGNVEVTIFFTFTVQAASQTQVVTTVVLAQTHQLAVQSAGHTLRSTTVSWTGAVEVAMFWWTGTDKIPVIVRGMWDGNNVLPVA